MFEIGFSEIMVIALLALIVLGPEKLPKVAAQLGRWTGRARSMARNLRMQLEQEVSYEELLREKERAEAALRSATQIHPQPTTTDTTPPASPATVEPAAPEPTSAAAPSASISASAEPVANEHVGPKP